ncbi:hypothetical protein [Stenotrophomonas sp.]|uniref:hypothetical protein n=1 Tax=Stenotrophomonas sp. TaxID=69392 RepID=UPI00289FBBBB|nr:hypothetical protein [Stenotrophomonas sp.]
MEISVRPSTYGVLAAALGLIATPIVGRADELPSTDGAPVMLPPEAAGKVCCPGTDHTVQHRSMGSGHQHPAARDLSVHPYWNVLGFEQDGTTYYQVSDLSGIVHLITGGIDGVYSALPVAESGAGLHLPKQPTLLNGEFSLHLDVDSEGATWRLEVGAPKP